MITYEDECVGCPPEMGCLGCLCPNRNVPHFFCDDCGEEFGPEDLWDVEGQMLCKDCITHLYKSVDDTLYQNEGR